ncbi:serine--tRNA ligase [Bacteroidetes bacterium endosymbiont of Geopemphigus sp.]|uniref:serine--tRNA ligase n=1 Tax=Bacteroidetes bacterium endosymbiont of Geopemphigus sp. TaxID=2047937 RepID=UPI000CD1357F|nr:serine--tRNA ligase [Bacteroidetes bacterium endosymbiont of Geopemphigus sp.]
MLQVSFIRENREKVLEGLEKRHFSKTDLIDKILEFDKLRKRIQFQYNERLAESNRLSREIGKLFQNNQEKQANVLRDSSAILKERIIRLGNELFEHEQWLSRALLEVPNIPHELVKTGRSAQDNEIIDQQGALPSLKEGILTHWELAKKFQLINWELGVQISGSGFPVYTGQGARLQRALIEYFVNYNTHAGYLEYALPHLVNATSAQGTGQLPDKEGQMYHVSQDDLYLIPTGEVPLMNCFRDKLLQEQQLPLKITTYTPCFRREAGSYGVHVRGLNRLHQFDKVEIVQITTPETSYEALEEMVKHVKGLLNSLNLPFRILRLCGGDMGFTSAMTYDFEVYSAVQGRWLEVSSVSNCTNFQTHRLKLRYKNKAGKIQLCHALNASALALPRILASLLENYQSEDYIDLPEALVSFAGFKKITLPIS